MYTVPVHVEADDDMSDDCLLSCLSSYNTARQQYVKHDEPAAPKMMVVRPLPTKALVNN